MSHTSASSPGGSNRVVDLFRRYSISRRFALLALLIILLLGGVVLTFYAGIRESVDRGLAESQALLLDGHKTKIKVASDATASVLSEALKGVSDPQKKVEALRSLIEGFRYEKDQSGYFFVFQGTTNIAHANKDLQGKDMGDMRDVGSVYFIRDMNARAHEGGGFVQYTFPKQGKGDQPKLSYATMIPGTDMWLGTGVYIDNIDEEKGRILAASQMHVRQVLGRIATIVGISFLVFAVIVGCIVSSVVGPIREATEAVAKCAEGQLDIVLDDSGQDEAAKMQSALNSMVQALKRQATNVDQLSVGDLSVRFHVRSTHDELSKSLNRVVETLQALLSDMRTVTRSAADGQLDTRANASRHQGGYREIVEGFNGTLDAVVGPLHVAADCVTRIGRGEIPEKITSHYKGDFDTLKISLNACISGLDGLVEANRVLQGMAVNDYSREIEGTYTGIFHEVKTAVNNVQHRVKHAIAVTNNLARGEFSDLPELKKIGRRSEKDEYMPALILSMESVQRMVQDVGQVAQAAWEGRLGVRADAQHHQGEYRKVLEGFNETLNAVIGPLNVAAEYVDRIGKGDIPQKITDVYRGDFNDLKNNINACIDGLGGLLEAKDILQRMSVNDYRNGMTGTYMGVFHEVKEAVNTVQGRIKNVVRITKNIAMGDLDELPDLKKVGRRSEHDELLPAMILAMENVHALVTDATHLSEAAVAGRLDQRADASRHRGEYRQVVEGVNATLDAVVGPINEAEQVLDRLAERDLTARMRGDYRGKLGNIKNSLNRAVDNLQETLRSVVMGTEQVTSATHEISSGSQSLAAGASKQAGSLEEISSSLHEMSSMTMQNTSNAREARALSESARGTCEVGVQTMARLTRSMESIKASSHSTAKIIKTIDEIAFQTNLLALNAAVEAARAGDAGRGFAVVAEEVRNLAMRSAEAAKNTTQLIQEAVQNADSGVAINQEVLHNLEAINGQVVKVSEVMQEIAAASEQQSLGVQQIDSGIDCLNGLTQQVAANAEESASAAEELSAQANEMQGLVGQFNLGDERDSRNVSSSSHRSGQAPSMPGMTRGGMLPLGSGRPKGVKTTSTQERWARGRDLPPMSDDDLSLQEF